jgi:hypothetical protein
MPGMFLTKLALLLLQMFIHDLDPNNLKFGVSINSVFELLCGMLWFTGWQSVPSDGVVEVQRNRACCQKVSCHTNHCHVGGQ